VIDAEANPALAKLATLQGPSGDGWIIELHGYHYYNSSKYMGKEGNNHIQAYLTTNFMLQPILVPDETGKMVSFTPRQFGFSYPILLQDGRPQLVSIPNPDFDAEAIALAEQALQMNEIPLGQTVQELEDLIEEPPTLEVLKLDFVYQIVWQPTTMADRLEVKRLAEEAKAAEEAAAAEAAAQAVAAAPQ